LKGGEVKGLNLSIGASKNKKKAIRTILEDIFKCSYHSYEQVVIFFKGIIPSYDIKRYAGDFREFFREGMDTHFIVLKTSGKAF